MSEDHSSLSARVFHAIREDILNGKYQANEELKEKSIGEELGVSRTPVREALRQLELEGLVHIIPNKGAFVEGITLKDVKDIYEIRALLEGLCARWAAETLRRSRLRNWKRMFFFRISISQGNWDQMVELDNRFHELVYEACGSKELTHVLRDYHHYLQRIRKITLEQKTRARASMDEHRRIAEALKARDAKTAEKYAREHIRNTMANMDKYGWENLMK